MKFPSAVSIKKPSRVKGKRCHLKGPGWNNRARHALVRLIEQGAGKGLPVVFDFDNTIINGDVGEAVLALLAAQRRLVPGKLSESLCPPVLVPGKGPLRIRHCPDVMEYYEALLHPTIHGKRDPAPFANGYVWAAQALEGLTIADTLATTSAVFELGQEPEVHFIRARPDGTPYAAPRFRPEIVELIAQLIQFQYKVWIVSASNVWSVRWMVVHGLNPLLRKHGLYSGVPPAQVLGLATLLKDRRGFFYKDSVLLRQDRDYAALRGPLMKLRLTRHLEYPVPVYSGKVACILDSIGSNPYLCAGDSPSDHAMMLISRHRLWIARREKRQSQLLTRALMRRHGQARWILQASTAAGAPGLIPNPFRL